MRIFCLLLLVSFLPETTIYAESSSLNRMLSLCKEVVSPFSLRTTQYLDFHSIEVSITGKHGVLYTQFATHLGGHEYQKVLWALERDHNDTMVVEILHNFLKQYSSLIEHQRNLGQELVRIVETSEIQWVGVEPGNFRSMMPSIFLTHMEGAEIDLADTKDLLITSVRDQRMRINRRLSSSPDWNDEKTKRLLYLLYPRWVVVMALRRRSFANVRWVLLGDKELDDKTIAVHEALLGLVPVMRIMQDNNFAPKARRFHALDIKNVDNFERIISDGQRKEILDEFDREGFPELKVFVERYIDARNKWFGLNDERDRVFANNISKQEGQGIAILGSAHRAGVLEYLRQLSH